MNVLVSHLTLDEDDVVPPKVFADCTEHLKHKPIKQYSNEFNLVE